AGADLSDKSIKELLTMDSKEFTMGQTKVEIAQVNTVDIAEVYEKQEEIEETIAQIIEEKDLGLFLFVVTDILNNDTEIFDIGNDENNIEKVFNIALANQRSLLKRVVSRMKQIVLKLTDAFTV